ncbi:hypothetical protein E4U47_008303 [Claviceps purpurea]|nr:hypothetical protein E4U23_006528 [Claviceps purpurea]KAG6276465.1 hypothetical protein E4U47_008303 [Claviceps purpurea]
MEGHAPDRASDTNSQLAQPPAPVENPPAPAPHKYVLTAARRDMRERQIDAITAEQLISTSTIPEWPKASPGGFAYAVNIHDTSAAAIERPWESVQYQLKRMAPIVDVMSDVLGTVAVRLHKFRCSGIRRCEYLDESLLNPASFPDAGEYWEKRDVREPLTRRSEQKRLRNVASWAWTIKNDYSSLKACRSSSTGHLPSCRPIIFSNAEQAAGCRIQRWVRCHNHAHGNEHQNEQIPSEFDTHLAKLEEILTSTNGLYLQDRCHVWDSLRSRKKTCDVAHLNGFGNMIIHECPVEMWFIVPMPTKNLDPSIFPILINSIGTHSHPPPPPTKISMNKPTLQRLFNGLTEARAANGNSQPGLRLWQQSPVFQDFLQDYNIETIAQDDVKRISHIYLAYLIRKHRAIHEPSTSLRLGSLQSWLMLQSSSRLYHHYTQAVVNIGADFLAICFDEVQARLWPGVHTFQMDVSSRNVHGQVQHEVIFGARIEHKNNKLIPLARAYMTSQTALVYKTLFEKLLHFKRLNSISHVSVRWQHIHQEGVVGVTLPQNAEAVQGLGEYLHSLDSSLDVEGHIMRCVRYCRADFDRDVDAQCIEAGDSDRSAGSMRQKMMSLPDAETPAAYIELCSRLEAEYPCLKDWVRHKMTRSIACGLCPAMSHLSRSDWNSLSRDTTELASLHEQSHKEQFFKADGSHISWLQSIKSAEDIDMQQYRASTAVNRIGGSVGYQQHCARERSISTDRSPSGSESPLPSSENDYGNFPPVASSTGAKRSMSSTSSIRSPKRPRVEISSRLTQPAPTQTAPNAYWLCMDALIGLLREPNVPEETRQCAKAQIKDLLDEL